MNLPDSDFSIDFTMVMMKHNIYSEESTAVEAFFEGSAQNVSRCSC